MSNQRYDYAGRVDVIEPVAGGALKIIATVTRSGVFEYQYSDGSIVREYRPPEEVFSEASLSTLPHCAFTLSHPPEPVTPDNFSTYAQGHCGPLFVRADSLVAGEVIIAGRQAINSIMLGMRELSAGYTVDIDPTPGVTDEGEAYDVIQRNIRYNHVALVESGRAGPDVRLRIDSAGDQLREEGTTIDMEEIKQLQLEIGTLRDQVALLLEAKQTQDTAPVETVVDATPEDINVDVDFDVLVSDRVEALDTARAAGLSLDSSTSTRDLRVKVVETVLKIDAREASDEKLAGLYEAARAHNAQVDRVLQSINTTREDNEVERYASPAERARGIK